MTTTETWEIEARFLRYRWLTKWMPGNVYSMCVTADLTMAEAQKEVGFAIAHGAFAACARGKSHIITAGACRVVEPAL